MDQFAIEHPIPQNVTSFEFHLVGDMTLKQFAYLGAGLGSAYLVFATLIPVNTLIAASLIVLFSLAGVAFAFFPILDRPLDHWTLAFFKAVYSPTKGMWKFPGKKDLNLNDQWFKNRLSTYLLSLGVSPFSVPEPASPPQITNRPQLTRINPAPGTIPSEQKKADNTPNPTTEELNKLVEMAKNTQILQQKLSEMEKQINELKAASIMPITQNPAFTKEINQASEALQDLTKQAKESNYQTGITGIISKDIPPKKPNIVVVETAKPTKTQLLLTTFPNIINGVVSDNDGNYLEGVIVIIHNQEGLPVRASKTNKLGQFTGATPLPPGVYNLIFEKEGLQFETIQITLNNEVTAPLRISPIKVKKEET